MLGVEWGGVGASCPEHGNVHPMKQNFQRWETSRERQQEMHLCRSFPRPQPTLEPKANSLTDPTSRSPGTLQAGLPATPKGGTWAVAVVSWSPAFFFFFPKPQPVGLSFSQRRMHSAHR